MFFTTRAAASAHEVGAFVDPAVSLDMLLVRVRQCAAVRTPASWSLWLMAVIAVKQRTKAARRTRAA